jgi:hypothetical protein
VAGSIRSSASGAAKPGEELAQREPFSEVDGERTLRVLTQPTTTDDLIESPWILTA